jgi:integrase/recombinase XerD
MLVLKAMVSKGAINLKPSRTPMVPEDMLTPTYVVFSRHSEKCEHKSDNSYLRCNCKKWIRVYDPRITDPKKRQTQFLDQHGQVRRSPFSAKTRSAADAEKIRQALEDSHDPDKRRAAAAEAKLKALQTEKESKAVIIEKAVAAFLASKKAERISDKRIERYLPLLGDVNTETLTFKRNRRSNEGRLSEWLKTLSPRPVYISDLTPVLIESFRNTWDFESDLTDFGTFGDLKRFFNYCVGKRWVETHPMTGMRPPKVKRGSRTTAFSEPQYDSILATIKSRFPVEIKSLEDQKLHDDTHRILAFIELMRWGGLALGDAVRFKFDSMKDNGQIAYYRTKTKRRVQPRLVPHVVALLKTTVPIDGDLNQPFYDKSVDADTNAGYWSAELKSVFADAGIESVKTDIRERGPHSHMLRDTFAINQLRTQYEEGHVNHQTIADALGDTVNIFLKHYAPWIAEFEQAHQDAQARIVEAQVAKLAQKQASQDSKVTSIAEGRK